MHVESTQLLLYAVCGGVGDATYKNLWAAVTLQAISPSNC